jgi:short-subunit dehydrogenase
MANESISQFAVVTGATSRIGLELARQFAQHGFDLLICADGPDIKQAADDLRREGHRVDTLRADLATYDGVERLCDAIRRDARWVDAIAINAGVGSSGAFVETDLAREFRTIQLNVTSVVHLAKRMLPGMLARNEGRILFTSSITAEAPGPHEAVSAASNAFVQSFALALRNELKDTNITVAALQPGATELPFFDRADAMDGKPKERLTIAAGKAMAEKTAAERHQRQADPGSTNP